MSNVLHEFNSLFSTVHVCAVYSTCTLIILFGIIFLLTYSVYILELVVAAQIRL